MDMAGEQPAERPVAAGVAEFQGEYGAYSFSEKLLQKIWLRGAFDRAALTTSDGVRVRVHHPGRWNLLGGPDFKDARLRLGDGPELTGDIELHLHAKDWAVHGHASDPAYDRVILHVVLFPPDPGQCTRARDGRELPVVALLPLLHHDLEQFAAEEAVEARRVPMKELLDGEERGQRVMLKWLARMPAGQAGAGGGAPMPPPPPGLEAWPPGGGQEVLRASWPAVGKLFNALREMAKRPYHLREPLPPPDDILMRMTADLYPKLWFSDARARTTPRLRIAALAARCFLLEKGHLPGGLAELTPAYLERLPGDPFYVGPLHSTTADGALVVYSIGPDGADDGGAAIVGTVKIESKGDVVVRVAGR